MSFAPEDRLLIYCSQAVLDEQAKRAAGRLLQFDLDWNYILETSIAHGVTPLFYKGLAQLKRFVAPEEKVPGHILEELGTLYQGNQLRNARLYRVLDEIAGAFECAGIPVLGLKDIQLAKEIYSELGLRPMGDLDLLIHHTDYERAAQCLNNLGFMPLPSADTPFTLKYAWGQHFRRASDNVWIDLQWNIIQREWDIYREGNFDIEIEQMWQGAKPMPLYDHTILVPQPEEMLFHLCLHLEGHHYSELILFCDIAELIKQCAYQLDWTYFIGITKRRKAQSSVYYVLFLIQHLFQVDLPPALFTEIAPEYFNANIFSALYENLTELHLSLDRIRCVALPPGEILNDLETIVRRQALAATQVYREMNALATEFVHTGGQIILFHGTPSQKIFPDASLRAFEEITVLILNSDLELIRQALLNHGYMPEKTERFDGYVRQWQVVSVDPSLHSIPISMVMRAEVKTNFDRFLHQQSTASFSKKEIALESIRAKLAHRDESPSFPLQINIAAFSPEELFVCASLRAGQQTHERLFELCSLLEFFKGKSNSLGWAKVASIAERTGVSGPVAKGIAMVSEFLDKTQLEGSQNGTIELPVRVLESARYDLDSWGRYTALTKPFYFVLSLLSIRDLQSRLRYLLGSTLGNSDRKPVLPQLIRELVSGSSGPRKPRTVRDFAYWIEP